MALKRRKYPSKLLLFGEYGVLLGLDALAIPFREFSGRLEKTGDQEDENLKGLYTHIERVKKSLPFNVDMAGFEKDITRGLIFNSEIPHNYGLGSSGALVASIFENYFEPKNKKQRTDLRALKTTLALIESFFHGVSSGIDPIVSLINKPILVRKGGGVIMLNKPILPSKRKFQFFLIDSNMPGKTEHLVEKFMNKMNNKEYSDSFRLAYQRYSNGAISSLINKNYLKFISCYKKLSEFQLTEMNELIPEPFRDLFLDGIKTNDYYLKICGSGGGGFFLGITQNKEKVINSIKAPVIFI